MTKQVQQAIIPTHILGSTGTVDGSNLGYRSLADFKKTDLGTGTSGIAFPIGTTAQRDGSPVTGLARYNTDLRIMEYYDGVAQVWRGFGEQFIEIGTPMGGGYFAGYISTTGNGVPDHYLIVAPVNGGQSPTALAYRDVTGDADPASFIDGPTNTATLVALGAGKAPAAEFCDGLNALNGGQGLNGVTGWYMPARYELDVLYFSLKPTIAANSTVSPDNPNAVPPRTARPPAGPPVQTKAAQFRDGNIEAFVAGIYWSSSQNNPTTAWSQNFANGGFGGTTKTIGIRVRAVRRIAI